MNLDETTGCILDEIMLQYTSNQSNLDELMYDDYNLDYTYETDYTYDLDEHTQELDEEYARDTQDYESLAYRHYA